MKPVSKRSFGASVANKKRQFIEFSIGKHKFTVNLPLSGIALTEFASKGDDEGLKAVGAVGTFMNEVLGDEQFAKFRLASAENGVGLEELIEISSWVIEEGTGRPTQPALPSSGRRSSAGIGSADAATETD